MFRNLNQLVVAALALLVAAPLAAGPYSDATHGTRYNDPRFVGWATGIDMHWPTGFTPSGDYDDPTKALGAAPGTANDVVTFGNNGWAVLTFSRVIRNTPGPDLAVFENGFNAPALPGTLFAELAWVEVSTDGFNYARFPSVSTNAWPGELGSVDPTNIYNLAGKHINNNGQAWQGTPFDLSDLAGHPLVLSGAVQLDNINYVKIVDVYGHSDGTTRDEATSLINPATGLPWDKTHVIYDAGNLIPPPPNDVTTGFDLDAVGILEAVIGDANGDGKVDGGDLAIWQQHYDPRGRNAAANDASTGDFNGDGKVDGGDLALWQQHYDPVGISATSMTGDPLEYAPSVPEPATVFLFLAVFAAGILLRRKLRPCARTVAPSR